MIQAPDELREVAVGATVNLFVSVGRTSRRLKGTVRATRERGSDDEVLEVHVAESTPGAAEIVFWLGFTEDATFLLPLDAEDDALVYVKYKHNGGQTALYVDQVREVGVRSPADGDAPAVGRPSPSEESTSTGDRSHTAEENDAERPGLEGVRSTNERNCFQ